MFSFKLRIPLQNVLKTPPWIYIAVFFFGSTKNHQNLVFFGVRDIKCCRFDLSGSRCSKPCFSASIHQILVPRILFQWKILSELGDIGPRSSKSQHFHWFPIVIYKGDLRQNQGFSSNFQLQEQGWGFQRLGAARVGTLVWWGPRSRFCRKSWFPDIFDFPNQS